VQRIRKNPPDFSESKNCWNVLDKFRWTIGIVVSR